MNPLCGSATGVQSFSSPKIDSYEESLVTTNRVAESKSCGTLRKYFTQISASWARLWSTQWFSLCVFAYHRGESILRALTVDWNVFLSSRSRLRVPDAAPSCSHPFPAPPLCVSVHRPILLNFPFPGFLDRLCSVYRGNRGKVTCKIWSIHDGAGDRAGGPTSDPVTRSGATFQQGLPGESLGVSQEKMERPGLRGGDSGPMHFVYVHVCLCSNVCICLKARLWRLTRQSDVAQKPRANLHEIRWLTQYSACLCGSCWIA